VLLSVILYPLTSPSLMWALVSTRALLEGHPDLSTYLAQLAALDVLLLVLGGWLFESVLVGPGRKAPSTRGRRGRPSAPEAPKAKGRHERRR
jgi:heme exporter protein B